MISRVCLSPKLHVSSVRIPALPSVRRQLCSGKLPTALNADPSDDDDDNNNSYFRSLMVWRLAPAPALWQHLVPAADDERVVFVHPTGAHHDA